MLSLGAPCDGPPDGLRLHITSLPLALVHPPTREEASSGANSETALSSTPQIEANATYSVGQAVASKSMPEHKAGGAKAETTTTTSKGETRDKIQTPSWTLVKPGQDDEEEARDEVSGGVLKSPLKRLRHALPDEVGYLHQSCLELH